MEPAVWEQVFTIFHPVLVKRRKCAAIIELSIFQFSSPLTMGHHGTPWDHMALNSRPRHFRFYHLGHSWHLSTVEGAEKYGGQTWQKVRRTNMQHLSIKRDHMQSVLKIHENHMIDTSNHINISYQATYQHLFVSTSDAPTAPTHAPNILGRKKERRLERWNPPSSDRYPNVQ